MIFSLAFAITLFLYCLTGSMGICLEYRRLLSHRNFKLPLWKEYYKYPHSHLDELHKTFQKPWLQHLHGYPIEQPRRIQNLVSVDSNSQELKKSLLESLVSNNQLSIQLYNKIYWNEHNTPTPSLHPKHLK